ncbi:transposase [Moorena sp. SIO3I6]|uniref:transposase n=1 Tax=Moorena sp. SIO3I6 TaxID=2607831 RepID=UPI0013C5E23E|nr:transposase [Moorena sp. SIO3G5]NEP22402.1 transposase [Moorena sp. SIO3I6]NEP26209.1 transposase [Moorena sp. SIO3I6]
MIKTCIKHDICATNFFAQLKQYRGIATRYDKRAINFLGAIYLAATVIWLN